MSGHVLLLVGAPFSGKTLFYEQRLKQYTRISAAEVFASDPHANLRIVVQKIVALLKKGHKVVIDDENSERQTRLSFIAGISKKVPGTTYSCFQFIPYGGTAQLHVCKEWARGRMFLKILQCLSSDLRRPLNFQSVSSRIESHSTNIIDLKLDWDRFKHFKKVSSPLVCLSSHKLTTPVLLMQWEGMVESAKGGKLLRKGVCEAVLKWTAANSDGNIVILFDSEGGGSHIQHEELLLLYTILEKVPNSPPIHYAITKESVDCGRPPNTGLVVWIAYLLAASVHHKVNTVHYSEHESHHILQTVTHFNPESTVTSPSSSPPPTASTRTLPLFVLAKQLNEEGQNCSKHGLHATWSTINCRLESKLEEASVSVEEGKNVSANDGSGRVLGMVYKRFELLKRFQDKWQGTLLAVTETSIEFDSEGEEQGESSHDITAEPQGGVGEAAAAPPNTSSQSLDPNSTTNVAPKTSSISSSLVNRSLPNWIRESSLEDSNSQSSACSQSKREPKQRMPRCLTSTPRQPQYRMTESELLATAVEYLTEHKESSIKRHCIDSSTTESHEESSVVEERDEVCVHENQQVLKPQDVVVSRIADSMEASTSVPSTCSSAVGHSDVHLHTTGSRLVVKPTDKTISFLDELFM